MSKPANPIDENGLSPETVTVPSAKDTPPVVNGYKFTITLNDAEVARLAALATARKKSPEQCLKDFIAACQPSGGGWTSPDQPSKKSA